MELIIKPVEKILILFLLVLSGVESDAQTSVWSGRREMWSNGSGTPNDPYLIETADNLAFMAYMVNKGFDTEGLYFRLTTDLDLGSREGHYWEPIGLGDRWSNEDGCDRGFLESGTSFRGHFDGGFHNISNIYVVEGLTNAGLFGSVIGQENNPAVIENVLVVHGSIHGNNSGGIIGSCCFTVVSRCGNGATVQGVVAGGIAGCAIDFTFTNCYNTGPISSIFDNLGDLSVAGGLVGFSQNSIQMANSYNVGEIISEDYSHCLVGYSMGGAMTIDNCHFLSTCDQSEYGMPHEETFMRTLAFVDLLNSTNTELVWAFDLNNDNNGFPILAEEVCSIMLESSPFEGGTALGEGPFAKGATCAVSAIANERYVFVNWTENEETISNDTVYVFEVSSNRNIVANFELESYEITTSSYPQGAGVIIGDGSYHYGEIVTLTAIPNDNYVFYHWTENGSVVSEMESFSFIAERPCELVAEFGYCEYTGETTSCIEVFPNPVRDLLFIKGAGIREMTVLNVLGQIVDCIEVNGREMTQIDVKKYTRGTLIFKISMENSSAFIKVMKQ